MTVDLRTGTSKPHDPLDYCTKIAAVAPAKPRTPHPLWTNFLDRVAAGNHDLIGFLQRYLGYCMTGHTTEHVLVFLYGTGANGKGVFINTVSKIFGTYAVVAPMELLIASDKDRHPTEIAKLMGARLVTAQETQKGRGWDEAKIKNLTGGDTLTARFMRQDYFDFTTKFKLLIAGNHKPTLRSVDEAIRRRVLLVPFTVQIPEHERDRELTHKLEGEWPAILRWMIDGCLEWRKDGLKVPTIVRDATNAYFSDEDTLGEWIGECVETNLGRTSTRTRELFISWNTWCESRKLRPGTEKSFAESISEKGFHRKRDRTGRSVFEGLRNSSPLRGAEWFSYFGRIRMCVCARLDGQKGNCPQHPSARRPGLPRTPPTQPPQRRVFPRRRQVTLWGWAERFDQPHTVVELIATNIDFMSERAHTSVERQCPETMDHARKPCRLR